MRCQGWAGRIVLVAALVAALGLVAVRTQAFEDPKDFRYPAFKGQWIRNVGAQWDPSKPQGIKQEAPLTPEYEAIYEANLAEAARGGDSFNPQVKCLPGGMPRMMIAYEPMEVIVTPEITYIWVEQMNEFRRIYTDGREWPEDPEPAFAGYSVGTWEDEDGDGRYDVLTVETRAMKGPRTFDANGIPLHRDNETVVKERIYLDKDNANVLHDELTTYDHALTSPWTVTRSYRRSAKAIWPQNLCIEDNHHVDIGPESYFVSDDGYLMPTRKGQPAPDLKYFSQSTK